MNFEEFILNMVDGIANTDYNMLGTVVAVISIIFWIVVTSWIWVDADERTTSTWMRVFYVFIGLIPVFGWIIYLIVRPSETIDEIYWGDLERRYLKYEARDLGDCPKCSTQLYPGFIFCPTCKKRIKRKCSNCGVYINLEYKYCTNCGNQMKSNVSKEESITQEDMQKQIEETKEEAHETVKSKKSKYKQEQNFLRGIGQSVIKGYKLLGEKIHELFVKIKPNKEKEERNNTSDQQIQENKKNNKQGDTSNNKKKKKRKKKKKKKRKKKQKRK